MLPPAPKRRESPPLGGKGHGGGHRSKGDRGVEVGDVAAGAEEKEAAPRRWKESW